MKMIISAAMSFLCYDAQLQTQQQNHFLRFTIIYLVYCISEWAINMVKTICVVRPGPE